jgi:hypothetical protein
MGKFVLTYLGGSMAATTTEQEAAMAKWGQWFSELGSAVTDMGNPFGTSTAVGSDGSRGDAKAGVTGYSIVSADSIEDAAALAKGCPILAAGGSVEIYEALEM